MEINNSCKRAIDMQRVINARHLGGFVTSDGRKTRDGLLLRTGHLAEASDEDIKALAETYHVTKIFDLRTSMEVNENKDRPVPGAEPFHVSIIDTNGIIGMNMSRIYNCPGNSKNERLLNFIMSESAKMLTDGFYISFVDDEYSQSKFTFILKEIVNTPDGAVLWHCSEGKDRTGLVAIFILTALGVDKESVLQDFDRSNVAYEPIISEISRQVIERGGDEEALAITKGLFGVSRRWMEDAWDFIDRHFGSMDSYIRDVLKLTEEDIAVLKDRYLE